MAVVFLNVLASQTLADEKDGAKILATLCEVAPHLAPQRYGNHEPLRDEFDLSNVQRSLGIWESPPFLWKRERPHFSGSIFTATGKVPQHAVLALSGGSSKYASEAVDLIQHWSSGVTADFGFVHVLSEKDIRTGMRAGVVSPLDARRTRFTMLVTTHILRKYVPDVYWATVFGPAYVRHFGKERLMSAPAPIVRELERDMVYMQMSHDLNDMTVDASYVETVRAQVKAHLGDSSFFSEDLGADHGYSIPEFSLQAADVRSSA